MKMSRLSFFILLLCLTSAGRADLTITQKIEGAGPISEMVMKIKGDKARVEPNAKMTSIIDSKSGEMLNLINDQKKFMRINAAQAKSVADLAMKGEPNKQPAEKPKLTSTGRKETILGYEAEEYVCDTPSFKATYWFSSKFPDAKKILQEMQAMIPAAWNMNAHGMPDYRDFPGLPLRSSVNLGGKEITTTLISIKQDPLEESEFVPPKDFQEIKMPNMNGILGGKPAEPGASPK